jgi:orotidine-5'-phosphate decarboxylase
VSLAWPFSGLRQGGAKSRLIFALDVASMREAEHLVRTLARDVGLFKIGKQLFLHAGPPVVRMVRERGGDVFLDLKFHDIPNTVATAVAAATSLGVWMVNVHASGGRRMMEAARDAAADAAARDGRIRPLVIGVTVLTSMNAEALAETGITAPLMDQVVRLARLAQEAGLDGVVASPQETQVIREACGPDFAIVTPGIRGGRATLSGTDDQERTMTAPEAIAAGASYIVVGRPIIGAEDPRAAAERIGGV